MGDEVSCETLINLCIAELKENKSDKQAEVLAEKGCLRSPSRRLIALFQCERVIKTAFIRRNTKELDVFVDKLRHCYQRAAPNSREIDTSFLDKLKDKSADLLAKTGEDTRQAAVGKALTKEKNQYKAKLKHEKRRLHTTLQLLTCRDKQLRDSYEKNDALQKQLAKKRKELLERGAACRQLEQYVEAAKAEKDRLKKELNEVSSAAIHSFQLESQIKEANLNVSTLTKNCVHLTEENRILKQRLCQFYQPMYQSCGLQQQLGTAAIYQTPTPPALLQNQSTEVNVGRRAEVGKRVLMCNTPSKQQEQEQVQTIGTSSTYHQLTFPSTTRHSLGSSTNEDYKLKRHKFSSYEKMVLEKVFSSGRCIRKQRLTELAQHLGLKERQIRRWLYKRRHDQKNKDSIVKLKNHSTAADDQEPIDLSSSSFE